MEERGFIQKHMPGLSGFLKAFPTFSTLREKERRRAMLKDAQGDKPAQVTVPPVKAIANNKEATSM